MIFEQPYAYTASFAPSQGCIWLAFFLGVWRPQQNFTSYRNYLYRDIETMLSYIEHFSHEMLEKQNSNNQNMVSMEECNKRQTMFQ